MIPEILAPQALTFIVPYLVKGGEELSKSITKDLWEKTKSVFQANGKGEALAKFEAMPNDAKKQGQIEYILQEELASNKSLADEFKTLIESARKERTYDSSVNQSGDNNIAVSGQISGSSISIGK
ncbi:MAG: hypothetical protein ACRYFX_23560 [Janthinobacterium lividum]